jgi:hypothetical protein
MEITVPGVADGPSALLCRERIDRGGDTWVNEGGCLDVRQGSRRRRDGAGSGRPRSGVAVDLDGGKGGGCFGGHRRRFDDKEGGRLRASSAAIDDKAGGLLNIGKRHLPHGHEAEKDGNAGWDRAITASPTSKVPLADVKYLGGAALCDAEPVDGGQVARFDEDRHRSVPDQSLSLDQVARCDQYKRTAGPVSAAVRLAGRMLLTPALALTPTRDGAPCHGRQPG